MHYEEFLIGISPNPAGDGFQVIFVSPYGSGQYTLALDDENAKACNSLFTGAAPQTPGRASETPLRHVDDPEDESRAGNIESLLPPAVVTKLRDTLTELGGRRACGEEVGLRLRLLLLPLISSSPRSTLDPRLLDLAARKWELFREPGGSGFLFLRRHVQIARTYHCLRALPALVVDPPLRVLLVKAQPRDLPGLNLTHEEKRIEAAIENNQRARIQVELSAPPTFENMVSMLRRGKHHALHFMGHGGLQGRTPVLYFENSASNSDPKSGRDLALAIADHTSLRLVILNACRSGEVPKPQGFEPVPGVAMALMMERVPAVIAMQKDVGDEPAIQFSAALYSSLASADPLEAAVAHGRLAIENWGNEWATPVLYLGTRDGNLFAVQPHPSELTVLKMRFLRVGDFYLAETPLSYGVLLTILPSALIDFRELKNAAHPRSPGENAWAHRVPAACFRSFVKVGNLLIAEEAEAKEKPVPYHLSFPTEDELRRALLSPAPSSWPGLTTRNASRGTHHSEKHHHSATPRRRHLCLREGRLGVLFQTARGWECVDLRGAGLRSELRYYLFRPALRLAGISNNGALQ